MKIIPIKYGESVLAESLIFQNGYKDKFRHVDFIVYLIKVRNKRILVDAGCETMPGFEMKNFIGSVKALEKHGIFADSITDIIITHAHHNHIECVKYFKNAVVHIQANEVRGSEKYIPKGFAVNVFDDEYMIYEEIKVIRIGGHTKGSCVVEVTDGKEHYVITGDECYIRECLEKKIPTGASFCPEKSQEFVERYSDEKYTVLLCHES